MIPRSMPKCAIIMEIECANFGKIRQNQWFFKASYGLLTSCHSDSTLETIESNILTMFQLSMSHCFGDMLRKNLVL